MKRIIALALALVLIFALAGCGGKKRKPIELTLSTEDSEAILAAAGIKLPEISEAAGANSVVKWFCWGNPFQNYSEDEIVNTGYWTFTHKYNSEIEYVETTFQEHNTRLSELVVGGTPPDIASGGTNSTAIYPLNCIKGMYQPVDDYINYDDPLWSDMKSFADYFTLAGKHYQIILNIKPANVCVYNRRVLDEWGYEDPAELYFNDDWTWEKFYEMCVDFSDGDEDRYALDGYAYVGMFTESAGQMMLMREPGGEFYSNADSPEIERGQGYLERLVKNGCTYHEGNNYWAVRDNVTFGAGMKDGKCLFYIIGESFFTDTVEEIGQLWGDMEQQEVMFAPLPRDEQGDGNYYISACFEDIRGSIAICYGAENPEGGALLATCMRFKIIDPVVIDIDRKQLQQVYLWNDAMLDMSAEVKEICMNNPILDLSGNLNENLQATHDKLCYGIARAANPTDWAKVKGDNEAAFEFYIAELNGDIAKFNAENS